MLKVQIQVCSDERYLFFDTSNESSERVAQTWCTSVILRRSKTGRTPQGGCEFVGSVDFSLCPPHLSRK